MIETNKIVRIIIGFHIISLVINNQFGILQKIYEIVSKILL